MIKDRCVQQCSMYCYVDTDETKARNKGVCKEKQIVLLAARLRLEWMSQPLIADICAKSSSRILVLPFCKLTSCCSKEVPWPSVCCIQQSAVLHKGDQWGDRINKLHRVQQFSIKVVNLQDSHFLFISLLYAELHFAVSSTQTVMVLLPCSRKWACSAPMLQIHGRKISSQTRLGNRCFK